MRDLGQLLIGAVVGAVLALGIGWGFGSPAEVPPIAADLDDVATTGYARDAEESRQDSPQLTRIEAKLAGLAAAIEAVERKVDALPARAPVRTPVATPNPRQVEIDSIVRALERVEEKKLEAMSVGQLFTESDRRLKANDAVAARSAVEAALARAVEPDDRARALTKLGIIHRMIGDSGASARVLQDAIAEFGVDSARGAAAAYQLVWTRNKTGDHRGALQLADTIASSANVGEMMRVQARWAAAILADAAGNWNRSRADLEAILREYGDSPEFAGLMKDVRRRLNR